MNRALHIVFTALFMAAIQAPAQDALQTLDPLIVTASRTAERLRDAPYTAGMVPSSAITSNFARTVPEALGLLPGVMVQKTAHGHGSPYIRGFTGRQNLFLVDGIRLNNSSWRSGPVQYANSIDPYVIDRLELVKGQGSVLYGSDAIGGTINAITKTSGFRDQEEGGSFINGTSIYRFDSNSGSHAGRLETRFGQGGKFGAALGISAKDFGDIRDSAVGLMKNTGYSEENFDIKVEYALSDKVTLTIAHQYLNHDDVWRWHSTIYNPGWTHNGSVTTPGTFLARTTDQERSLSYARIEGENQTGFIKRWSGTLSYQRQDEGEIQQRTLTDRREQAIRVQTYGLAVQLESEIGPGSAIYGADFYRDEVDSSGRINGVFRPDFRPVADDSTYETLGLFGQYRWQPLQPLNLTAGSRYTHSSVRLGRFFDAALPGDRSAGRHWDELVSMLRANWRIAPTWSVYGGASQGFRAPNLDDLSGNLTSRSGLTALGSTAVEPEKFINSELGIRHESEAFRIGAAVFHTDIRDVITSIPIAPGSSTTVTTNGQDGYVYGVELEGAWYLSPTLTMSGFAAWQDGRAETAEFLGGPESPEPLSRIMPLTGRLALRWTHPDGKLWIEGHLSAAARADRLSRADRRDVQRIPTGGTPGYVVTGIHGGWQLRQDLLATLALANLTDEDYRIHGSGQNEAGFNAIIGLQWNW